MKTFEEIKKYIVDFAQSKGACFSQLNKAKSAKNVDDLLSVVKDNLGWVSENQLFNGVTIEEWFEKEKLVEFNIANTGKGNSGFSNTGDRNTGDRNTGDWNTGDWNTGDWNTGDRNTGNSNTGYRNTGDWNTGDWNTGDRNTGDWNTGDRNTGYSNTGDRNTGAFCTGEKTIKIFNKESGWTDHDFCNSKAFNLLCEVDTKMWIWSSEMTDEEKKAFPSHATTGGYLKNIPYKDGFQNRWHNWNEGNRKAFTSLPNFDPEIFYEITGVDLRKEAANAQ